MALIKAGRRHGATWFLCIDADERLEHSFAAEAAGLLDDADHKGVDAYTLQLRELWNDRAHYRIDGIWGGKARYRLFRNDPQCTRNSTHVRCIATGCRLRSSATSKR